MTNGQWKLEELEAVLEFPEICILLVEAWGPGTSGRARSTLGPRPLRLTSGGQGYSVHCPLALNTNAMEKTQEI